MSIKQSNFGSSYRIGSIQQAVGRILHKLNFGFDAWPNIESEADFQPQEHYLAEAITEAKNNPDEPIKFSLNELDNYLRKVNLIQFGSAPPGYEA